MSDVTMTVDIENIYADGYEACSTETVTVPSPPEGWTPEIAEDDDGDWAYDNLFVLTGVGRDGDACYTVTIMACADIPELVGREFEWVG